MERISKLDANAVDGLLKVTREGIENGDIDIFEERQGISIRFSKKYIASQKIMGLTTEEVSDLVGALVSVTFDLVASIEDENKPLSKALDLPDALEETLRRVYDEMKRTGTLDHLNYRVHSTSPTLQFSTFQTVAGTLRLVEPVNKSYPVMDLAFIVNNQGELQAVTIQVDKVELTRLIKKLSDGVSEIDKLGSR